tara:strand:- start:39 stop:422 length:384 start_codon:yes stop_codon:yes gene_type:complete
MSAFQVCFVLASDSPQNLASFYASALDAPIQAGFNKDHWVIQHPEGVRIQVFRPSSTTSFKRGGRSFSLCLIKPKSNDPLKDLNKVIQTLQMIGAKVVEEGRLDEFGAESWLSDPEGNEFLILVPKN